MCIMIFFNRLSVCEKALAEYLETKRLTFPRFYFISSADLLDILSKGNQPSLVITCTYTAHVHVHCTIPIIHFVIHVHVPVPVGGPSSF